MSRRPSEPRPGSGQQPQTSAAIQLSVSAEDFVALGQTQNSRRTQGIGYGGQAGMGYAGQQGSIPVSGWQGYHGPPGISQIHPQFQQQQGVQSSWGSSGSPAQRGGGSGYSAQADGGSYGSPAQAARSYGSQAGGGSCGSPAQAARSYGSQAQAARSYGSQAGGGNYGSPAGGSHGSPAGGGSHGSPAGGSHGSAPYRAQSGGGPYGAQSGGGGWRSRKKQQYEKKLQDEEQISLDFQKHAKNNPKAFKGQLTLKIRVPQHVEATNLEFMFKNSTDRDKVGEFGFVDFETSSEAVLAKVKWEGFEKISKDGTTKEPAYEVTLIPVTAVEESKREAQAAAPEVQGNGNVRNTHSHWLHNLLITDEFNWCNVEEFSYRENKAFAKAFKFEVAAEHGSVSPDLVLCDGTETGSIVFSSVLSYLFQQHLDGKTYKGNVKLDHLVLSQKLMLCAIVQNTSDLTDPLDLQADVDSVVNSLLPLYRVNGQLPPYYDCMVKRSKDAPYTIIPGEMEVFQKEMLGQCCFAPFELRAFLVQESHIINKNLHTDSKKDFNVSAPKHLEDWIIIHEVDRLMTKVVIGGTSTQCNFAHEGSHMRQIVDHTPEHIVKKPNVHLPLKERDMLIYYYYKKYLPEFVKLMYAERANQPWLNELCESYERARLVKTTIPFAAVPYAVYVEEEEVIWDWEPIEAQLAEAELEEDTGEAIEGEQLAEAELVNKGAEDTREAIQEEQQADEENPSKEAKDATDKGNSSDQAGAETHDGVEDAYH